MKYVLAADIGGTKARFAIFDNKLNYVIKKEYHSKNYKSILELIKVFLKKTNKKISSACFALPCPIQENKCKLTNLPWIIDKKELENNLKIKVILVNDFEAVCYAIKRLKEKNFITLQKGELNKKKPAIVLGAGTGLGKAIILPNNNILPSEGGHRDFAPRNEIEIKLLKFLIKKFKRVSYERVLSGPGISNIYQFLTKKKEKPEVITEQALKKNKKAKQTLQVFSSIYGSEAGNMVLELQSFRGVYLAGGIALKILPKFKKEFMNSFMNKGRLSYVLKKVPVKIIKHANPGLLGAGVLALKKNI